MDENKWLERITVNPKIFGGMPIIRGRRIAVEHILGMLAAGDAPETILKGSPWLEMEDISANSIISLLRSPDVRAGAGRSPSRGVSLTAS